MIYKIPFVIALWSTYGFTKTCVIWHEVIRCFSAAFCLITNNLCMVPVLSCGSVDKKPEGCRDDLFKFKARPLDRKVACVQNLLSICEIVL